MTTSTFRRVVLSLAGAMAVAVLAQAQQVPKDSKATAETAAPSTTVPAKDAQPTKVASAAQKAADPSAVLLRDATNAGFKPEQVRGHLMFCRTTTEVGSRFPVRTCYDEEHMKIKIQEYQAQRDQMQQHRGFPQLCNPPHGTAASAAIC